MNLACDRFRLHAYVDGELTPDEVADLERSLAQDADAMAEVAALRSQAVALHARYDGLLAASSSAAAETVPKPWRRPRWSLPSVSARATASAALAAAVLLAVGVGTGWTARDRADRPAAVAGRSPGDVEGRLQSFVQVAGLSHAVFVPEVRHPVEVAASDEAHLVAWLSKRLDAPLVIPHLGDAGWNLLGGRLLPAAGGPVAQFMYQDAGHRRLTLAVSRGVASAGPKAPSAAPPAAGASFRIAEEAGTTVFYWIDADYAYALTGTLPRSEMTALAGRVHRQLDR